MPWWEAIGENIAEADACLVFLSAKSLCDDTVRKRVELIYVRRGSVHLLPLRLDADLGNIQIPAIECCNWFDISSPHDWDCSQQSLRRFLPLV